MSNLLMKVDRASEQEIKDPAIAAALDACEALQLILARPDVLSLNWREGPATSEDSVGYASDQGSWKPVLVVRPKDRMITCQQGNTDDGIKCSSTVSSWKAFGTHINSKHKKNPPHPWTKSSSRPEDDRYKDLGEVAEPKVRCEYCGFNVTSRKFNVSLYLFSFVSRLVTCNLYVVNVALSDTLGRRKQHEKFRPCESAQHAGMETAGKIPLPPLFNL